MLFRGSALAVPLEELAGALLLGRAEDLLRGSLLHKQIQGAVFTIDNSTGCCTQVQRVVFS